MALQKDAFEQWVDTQDFSENNYTIVRVEASEMLNSDTLRGMQKGTANITIRSGRYSWTKFETWQKALQYYRTHHRTTQGESFLTAAPVTHPTLDFDQLINKYHNAIRQLEAPERVSAVQRSLVVDLDRT